MVVVLLRFSSLPHPPSLLLAEALKCVSVMAANNPHEVIIIIIGSHGHNDISPSFPSPPPSLPSPLPALLPSSLLPSSGMEEVKSHWISSSY